MKKNDLAKKIKAARKALGLNGKSQQELLRGVRDAYGLSNQELADALGVSLDTLLAYLQAEETKKFRRMPEADKLVLARILEEHKRSK